jgi:hypothetical protein
MSKISDLKTAYGRIEKRENLEKEDKLNLLPNGLIDEVVNNHNLKEVASC